MDIFTCAPHNDLLLNRQENLAYASADPGRVYAVYFPGGRPVDLDLRDAPGTWREQWLNIAAGKWEKTQNLTGGKIVNLHPPTEAHWAVLICRPEHEDEKH